MYWLKFKQLNSRNTSKRERAIEFLVKAASANPQIGIQLNEIIRHYHYKKQRAMISACEALGKIGYVESVQNMINLIRYGGLLGEQAEIALCEMGEASLNPLIQMANSAYTDERHKAFSVLRRVGVPAVNPILINMEKPNLFDEVRTAQAEVVCEILGPAEAEKVMIALLEKQSGNARAAAAIMLGRMKGVSAIQPLAEACQDKNRQLQRAATSALIQIGPPALNELCRALSLPEIPGRSEILDLVESLEDRSCLPVLVPAMQVGENSIRKRILALLKGSGWHANSDEERALSLIANERWDELILLGQAAVNPLMAAIEYWGREDMTGLIEAVNTLGRLEAATSISLLSSLSMEKYYPELQLAAFQALTAIKSPETLEPLLIGLKSDRREIRDSAAAGLAGIGTDCIDRLIKELREAERFSKAKAPLIHALGEIRAPQCIPVLLDYLGDGDHDVRLETVEALAGFGLLIENEILAILSNADTDECRISCIQLLGKIGARTSVGALSVALFSRTHTVAAAAAKVLGDMGDVRAVEPLIQVLGCEDGKIRQAAAAALEKLGEPQWKEMVNITVFDHTAPGNLRSCITNLGKSNDRRAAAALIEAAKIYEIRETTVQAMVDLNESAPLMEALEDRDVDTRRAAAEALGRMGHQQAVGPLIRLLGNSGYRHARLEAAVALDKLGESTWKEWVKSEDADFERLGSSGDPRAVEPLLKALKESVRKEIPAVASALARLGHPAAIEPLISMLADGEWDIRKAVAAALIEFAKNQPRVLVERWDDVSTRIQSKHTDFRTHSDNTYPGSSDCTHSDHHHEDKGIGMTFPDKSQNLDF